MNNSAKKLIHSSENNNSDKRINWIVNNPSETYWSVAKPGFSVNVDAKTPKQHLMKITFKKEISPGTCLTDNLYSSLLDELKSCLINAFQNGSIQKPYQLQSICRNIISFVISVNEHRFKFSQQPILSFSQITEEDVIDFVKSFEIDAELFFTVVDEITSLAKTPEKEDWLSIKNKFSIRSKTFSIIKNRIVNSKNTVVYSSFNTTQKEFKDANIRRSIDEMHLANKKTVKNYICDINHLFYSSDNQSNAMKFSPYDLVGSDEYLSIIFSDFQRELKTAAIPLEVSLHLICESLKFQCNYGKYIFEYLKSIDHHYKNCTAHLCKSTLMKECHRREKLFHEVVQPKELQNLKIKTLGLEKEPKDENHLSLTQAIYLYLASTYILLASFSATRELSLLLLKRNCFKQSPLDGLFDIVFKQQKSNTNNRLQEIFRPIPKPIYRLGIQYCEFSQYLENRYNIFHEDQDSYLFTNFHTIKKIITRHFSYSEYDLVANYVSSDLMQSILNYFSDWSSVPLIDGNRWYVSDHQFRRLFAVLYFNMTDEKGIEELSWFLGHEHLEMTFHYAEQNPTREWMDEAIISIAKRASSINKNISVDAEISNVINTAKEKCMKLNLQLESVVYQAINDRIKETGEQVHFERVDGKNIYFYFTKAD